LGTVRLGHRQPLHLGILIVVPAKRSLLVRVSRLVGVGATDGDDERKERERREAKVHVVFLRGEDAARERIGATFARATSRR
jgi:hypothetical protein